MTPTQQLMHEAKRTGKTIITCTSNHDSGRTFTEWTATPQENGAVELTYKIVKIKTT